MELSEKIKELRERAGLTQEQLAEQMGVQRNTVWRWENKKANLKAENIQSLSSVLKVEASELMSEELSLPDKTIVSDSYEDGRDILTDNKAGHLVFRDGDRVIDIPDTPENKNIYLRIVEQMLNVSGAMGRVKAAV